MRFIAVGIQGQTPKRTEMDGFLPFWDGCQAEHDPNWYIRGHEVEVVALARL